jgi:hypothetical protein
MSGHALRWLRRQARKPTARTTETERTTIAAGIAESRGRRTTRRCSHSESDNVATSSRRCSCPRASRCSLARTSSVAPSGGNNNAYCQDNEISWVDWSTAGGSDDLTELVASLCRLRMNTQALHRNRFFTEADILWLRPDGGQMTSEDWNDPVAHAVAITAPGGPFNC